MKDKAVFYGVRLYKRHRQIIKKGARKLRITEAEFVRRKLEAPNV